MDEPSRAGGDESGFVGGDRLGPGRGDGLRLDGDGLGDDLAEMVECELRRRGGWPRPCRCGRRR
jgi:hypothetical protein